MMSTSGRPPEMDRAYEHLDNVETQVPGALPNNPRELESLRASIEEYENTGDESRQVELLEAIDQEIDELRDTIQQEAEEGAEAAHDALEKVEPEVADLRARLHS